MPKWTWLGVQKWGPECVIPDVYSLILKNSSNKHFWSIQHVPGTIMEGIAPRGDPDPTANTWAFGSDQTSSNLGKR